MEVKCTSIGVRSLVAQCETAVLVCVCLPPFSVSKMTYQVWRTCGLWLTGERRPISRSKLTPRRSPEVAMRSGLGCTTFTLTMKWFKRHYHKRSNVETTVSMIKERFGTRLMSKKEVAQVNEVLCKVLCHNICIVDQSMYELGIEPVFWSDQKRAS